MAVAKGEPAPLGSRPLVQLSRLRRLLATGLTTARGLGRTITTTTGGTIGRLLRRQRHSFGHRRRRTATRNGLAPRRYCTHVTTRCTSIRRGYEVMYSICDGTIGLTRRLGGAQSDCSTRIHAISTGLSTVIGELSGGSSYHV